MFHLVPGLVGKQTSMKTLKWALLLFFSLLASQAQSQPAGLQLRLERRSNTLELVVNAAADSGAFFVYQADTLQSLAAGPTVAIQTNTPLTNGIRFSLSTPGTAPGQAFFKAVHWPGRSIDEFCGTNGTTTISNMVCIPGGTFTMGSPDSQPARNSNEGPQTRVTISRGFWMGKYEVTQGEYSSVMGNNPSYFTGDLNPVETVSWNDAVAYCSALNTREATAKRLPAGYVYRLPTEAEWEYACRAGTTTAFQYGDAFRSGMANFDGQYEYPHCGGQTYYCYNASGIYLGRTTTVGSYVPNAWGLYDMHGNVWEWCQDWWSSNLPGGSVTDPKGASTGSNRVVRGGSWYDDAWYCRSARRYEEDPEFRNYFIGFRVVLALSEP